MIKELITLTKHEATVMQSSNLLLAEMPPS